MFWSFDVIHIYVFDQKNIPPKTYDSECCALYIISKKQAGFDVFF